MPLHVDHLKAYTTGLAMAAVISVLDTTAANENSAEVDRQKAAEAMCYLAECLATLTSLVDPSAPSVNNVFMPDVIPREESGRRCGPSRTLLFDVARGLVR